MLLKNIDQERGLMNGSRGVVLRFEWASVEGQEQEIWAPICKFETAEGKIIEKAIDREEFRIELQGKTVAERQQFPLRLAYAISIHKCQGMTLPKVEMSLKDVFEAGQAYVALSRASSLEGLRLMDFDSRVVKAHPKVIHFYRSMNSTQSQMEMHRKEGSRSNPLLCDD
mmetsp:Transcript_15732/g.24461  ORF Transcript_15732/g.24461 Transcript_15732/m.24461 type:complete len:169 (-) Transcript_15732:671-1177(-)